MGDFDLTGEFTLPGFVSQYLQDLANYSQWGVYGALNNTVRFVKSPVAYTRDVGRAMALYAPVPAVRAVWANKVLPKIAPYSKVTGLNSKLFGSGQSLKIVGTVNKGILNRNNFIRIGWRVEKGVKNFRIAFGPGGSHAKGIWKYIPHGHIKNSYWPWR